MSAKARPTPTRAPATRATGRPQERGDRTRDAIIDETVRCVLEEGFAGMSANHIAERAGVTWGVIQYHFGGRNGLLTTVVANGYRAFRAAIEAVDIADGPTRERVTAVVDAAWSAFAAPESRVTLEILVATRPDRDPAVAFELEEMAKGMHRLGAKLVGDDPRRRAEGLAVGEVLWATLRGVALAQMVVRQPLDSTLTRATLVDLLVNYLDRNP
jgi:AcrR family transcriptional regulator